MLELEKKIWNPLESFLSKTLGVVQISKTEQIIVSNSLEMLCFIPNEFWGKYGYGAIAPSLG